MTYPPGTIILVSGELTRYATFTQSMLSLVAPPGSQVVWKPGVNIAGNLNLSLQERIGEWVFLMGDDHLFAPDVLWRLLRHEKDVVAPLVCKRKPPFDPLVYRQSSTNLMGIEGIPPAELPPGGLIPVAACACAGILIKRRVIDALVPPYFEVGQVKSDELQEDLYFLQKVRAKGFELYVDLDTKLGHSTPAHVWPQYQDGKWQVLIDLEGYVPEMGQ